MYVYETIVYTKMRMNESKTQAHNVERSPPVQQCRDTYKEVCDRIALLKDASRKRTAVT